MDVYDWLKCLQMDVYDWLRDTDSLIKYADSMSATSVDDTQLNQAVSWIFSVLRFCPFFPHVV